MSTKSILVHTDTVVRAKLSGLAVTRVTQRNQHTALTKSCNGYGHSIDSDTGLVNELQVPMKDQKGINGYNLRIPANEVLEMARYIEHHNNMAYPLNEGKPVKNTGKLFKAA